MKKNNFSRKDLFPKLWAEYPKKFYRLFKKNGTLTKEGQILNEDIKKRRRKRIARK